MGLLSVKKKKKKVKQLYVHLQHFGSCPVSKKIKAVLLIILIQNIHTAQIGWDLDKGRSGIIWLIYD